MNLAHAVIRLTARALKRLGLSYQPVPTRPHAARVRVGARPPKPRHGGRTHPSGIRNSRDEEA